MAKILGIGIATLDIINTVSEYPAEDSEVRAESQVLKRGGNTTNTLTVLSQLGHECSWAGTLACETDVKHITNDLDKYSIDYRYCKTYPAGKVPTSYIILNKTNGSRSIVHYRDLPELDFHDTANIPFQKFDWIHFEGRNVDETLKILKHIKEEHHSIPCSIEIEKQRDGIEELYAYSDYLFFSKAFCLQSGFNHAESFLQYISKQQSHKTLILAWGDKGSYAKVGDNNICHINAIKPEKITDTLGAGDTFNAGLINTLLTDQSIEAVLIAANKLASKKISVNGLDLKLS